jgi:hypothetical protein
LSLVAAVFLYLLESIDGVVGGGGDEKHITLREQLRVFPKLIDRMKIRMLSNSKGQVTCEVLLSVRLFPIYDQFSILLLKTNRFVAYYKFNFLQTFNQFCIIIRAGKFPNIEIYKCIPTEAAVV